MAILKYYYYVRLFTTTPKAQPESKLWLRAWIPHGILSYLDKVSKGMEWPWSITHKGGNRYYKQKNEIVEVFTFLEESWKEANFMVYKWYMMFFSLSFSHFTRINWYAAIISLFVMQNWMDFEHSP